jgi:Ca2+-binding EF-hand superfamily protein
MESGAEELFRHLDQDGDGTISSAEVESLLSDLGAEPSLRPEDGMLYLSGGQKSSGEITFDDFLKFRSQVSPSEHNRSLHPR